MDPRLTQLGWPPFCAGVPRQMGDVGVPPTVSSMVTTSQYPSVQPLLPDTGNSLTFYLYYISVISLIKYRSLEEYNKRPWPTE